MTASIPSAIEVFYQHNGDVTRAYYQHLTDTHGARGRLAVALFRALKRSKDPQGIGYRRVSRRKTESYDKAEAFNWAVQEIIRGLSLSITLDYAWGWRDGFLFVDLPTGQVSFICEDRGFAPLYEKQTELCVSTDIRIIQFCDSLDRESFARSHPIRHVQPNGTAA